MAPSEATLIVALESPVAEVSVRQRTPTAFVDHVAVMIVAAAPAELHPEIEGTLVDVAGTPPTPEVAITAHSLAIPIPLPTSAPAEAASLAPRNRGRATAAKMPTIATVIISSIRVKPLVLFLRSRRVRSRASLVLVFTVGSRVYEHRSQK
jgi:hypothetical protein